MEEEWVTVIDVQDAIQILRTWADNDGPAPSLVRAACDLLEQVLVERERLVPEHVAPEESRHDRNERLSDSYLRHDGSER